MEYHLDHRVVLDREPEFKNLYQWSLQELDADGKKIGRDEIPWQWDLYFTAIELALSDSIRVGHEYQVASGDTKPFTRTSQFIRAKLQPGRPGDRPHRRPSYSMFGTKRAISDFELTVHAIDSADAQPSCRAWGGVSYTAEFDFRDETTSDTVVFYLSVPPATFSDYARKIEADAIGEAVLRFGGVAGFYSDWSPSISADHIKVLTDDKEHKVEMPSDCEIEPPRLGQIKEAELYLRRTSKLDPMPAEPEDDWGEEDGSAQDIRTSAPPGVVAVSDARTIALLSSVRFAAWLVAALLLLLLVKRVLA